MNIIQTSHYQSIGIISRTHGVKGKFCVEIQSVFPEDLEDLDFILIMREGLPIPFAIEEIEYKDDQSLIIACEFIESREEAAKWIGESVLIHTDFCSEAEPELSLNDLIGFKTESEDGKSLGFIRDFIDIPGNPLFELEYGDSEILFPANDDLIVEINWDQQKIIFRIPEGLIELNSETAEEESDEIQA